MESKMNNILHETTLSNGVTIRIEEYRGTGQNTVFKVRELHSDGSQRKCTVFGMEQSEGLNRFLAGRYFNKIIDRENSEVKS